MGLTTEWQYQTRLGQKPIMLSPNIVIPSVTWKAALSSCILLRSLLLLSRRLARRSRRMVRRLRRGPASSTEELQSDISLPQSPILAPACPVPAYMNKVTVWPMWSQINLFLPHNHSFVWRFYFTVCLSFPCHSYSPSLISFFLLIFVGAMQQQQPGTGCRANVSVVSNIVPTWKMKVLRGRRINQGSRVKYFNQRLSAILEDI